MADGKEIQKDSNPGDSIVIKDLNELKEKLKKSGISNEKLEKMEDIKLEKDNVIKCTQEELNILVGSIQEAKDDNRVGELINEFVGKKQGILEKTKEKTDDLKKDFKPEQEQKKKLDIIPFKILEDFTIDNVKLDLELIQKQNIQELKSAMMTQFIDELSKKGYNIAFKGNDVEVLGTGKIKLELKGVLNSYIQNDKVDIKNVKESILLVSGSFGDYMKQITDSTGNIMKGKSVKSESYFKFLLEKYGVQRDANVNVNVINDKGEIPGKDKAFMLSYLSGAYVGVDIDTSLAIKAKEYKENIDKQKNWPKDSNIQKPSNWKDMDPKDIAAKAIGNPLGFVGDVLRQSGEFSPFVLIGMIYLAFTNFKKVMYGLVGIGLAKSFGITDIVAKYIKDEGFDGMYDKASGLAGDGYDFVKGKFTVIYGYIKDRGGDITEDLKVLKVLGYDLKEYNLTDKQFNKLLNESSDNTGNPKVNLEIKTDEGVKKFKDSMKYLKDIGIKKYGDEEKLKEAMNGKTLKESMALIYMKSDEKKEIKKEEEEKKDNKKSDETKDDSGEDHGNKDETGTSVVPSVKTTYNGKPSAGDNGSLDTNKNKLITKAEAVIDNITNKVNKENSYWNAEWGVNTKKEQLFTVLNDKIKAFIEVIGKTKDNIEIEKMKNNLEDFVRDLELMIRIYGNDDSEGFAFGIIHRDRDMITTNEFSNLLSFVTKYDIDSYNHIYLDDYGNMKPIGNLNFDKEVTNLIDKHDLVGTDKDFTSNSTRKIIEGQIEEVVKNIPLNEKEPSVTLYKKHLLHEIHLLLALKYKAYGWKEGNIWDNRIMKDAVKNLSSEVTNYQDWKIKKFKQI